jgi:hypothetical protein
VNGFKDEIATVQVLTKILTGFVSRTHIIGVIAVAGALPITQKTRI